MSDTDQYYALAPDGNKYPNCYAGHNYAVSVLEELETVGIHVFAACERYMEDLERDDLELRWKTAEKFMARFQLFEHVIGEWDTLNVVLEPWEKFFFLNTEMFYWKETGKRRFKTAHLEIGRGNGKAQCLETLIPTPGYGLIEIKFLGVGDEIYDRYGNICKIIGETPIHIPEQYVVKFSNGEIVKASADHLWFTSSTAERLLQTEDTNYESIRSTKDIYESYQGPLADRDFKAISKGIPKEWITIQEVTLIAEEDQVLMKCIEVDSPDHSYMITKQNIPTHNSLLASGTGLLYLSAIDVVKGNKVYSCATKNEQARIVLDSAREMAKANEEYRKNTGVEVFAHHIAVESKGCEFKALSSDSKSMDGLQPVLGIIDELHAHKTRDVYDVIDSAMSKRKDSFLLCITTAGFSLEGIGYSQSCYAKRVVVGDVDDDSFFSLVYTLDVNDDGDDDWKDPDVWVKANPNWGVSVDPENFINKAKKAMANPADAANFQVKHLNLWQNAHSQYFSVAKWDSLGNPNLKLSDFEGKSCFVAIDLASKVDLTSTVYVFKNLDTGKISIISRNFCPEDTVKDSKINQYPEWVEGGHLIATPGAMINYPKIREDIYDNVRNLKVTGIPYDPWNATEFSQHLTAHRLEAIEYRQNVANFSEPMKYFEAVIREGNIEHDGNPLVSWCLGNVVAKPDASDNVFPRKTHQDLKIDPIIAIIMGIGCWISEEENASVYEERGIRII